MKLLPFLPEFHEKVRSGRKTATARSKPYGKPGDKVQGPGVVLILEHVKLEPLGSIAHQCYWHEGLESPQEFIDIWNRIHPIVGYDPGVMVYFHRFRVEGRPPVCDGGWNLGTPEEKKAWNAETGGWMPERCIDVGCSLIFDKAMVRTYRKASKKQEKDGA